MSNTTTTTRRIQSTKGFLLMTLFRPCFFCKSHIFDIKSGSDRDPFTTFYIGQKTCCDPTGPGATLLELMPPPSTGSKGVSLAVEAMSWWRFITRQRLAPYHPMPTAVVHQSLKLANIGSSDHVVDLGCGDGRILITACRDYGARTGCGYELVPAIVSEAKHQVQQAKLDNQITIHQRDALSASLCDATVITCYLSAGGNALLAPRLMAHLHHHHHARAVSFLFDFDGIMTPAQTVLGDGGIPIHLYNHTSIPPHTMQQIQRQQTHEQSQTQSAAFTPTNTPTPTSTSTETSSSSPARVSLASSIFARLRSPFGS